MGIKGRVDEADGALAGVVAGFVDQGQDGPEDGRGARGAVHELPFTINGDD